MSRVTFIQVYNNSGREALGAVDTFSLFLEAIFIFENRPDHAYNSTEARLSMREGFELHESSGELRCLIERCNRGDGQAWEEFYSRYYRMVSIAVQKRCAKNPNDVEDIVQEVFCTLFAALKSYDPERSLEAYILTIARNVAIGKIRELTTEIRGGSNPPVPLDDDDPPGIDPTFRGDDPEELLRKAQEGHLLRRALDALSENCRRLIDLRRDEQKSYSEISIILGVKETTLRSQVKRCLSTLGAIYTKLSLHKEGRS